MDDDRHPCTLRWDSPRSVGNLYWNPLFEQLEVRYDELLDAWTIVPERGTCAIEMRDSRQDACERARRIQIGALAYWLLCESPPVGDNSDIATAVQEGDIPAATPISSVNSDVGDVIDRALETDPDDRYRSVSRFCRDLLNRV